MMRGKMLVYADYASLPWIFKTRQRGYTTNLPADAEVVSVHTEPHYQRIVMVMDSDLWEAVPRNNLLPEFALVFVDR